MRYRKKPVEIEAMQLTRENGPAVAAWCGGEWHSLEGRGDRGEDISHVMIHTLEGDMRADLGSHVIKGVQGEFYPCKPDIFAATYDAVPAPVPDGVCGVCGESMNGSPFRYHNYDCGSVRIDPAALAARVAQDQRLLSKLKG